MNKIKRKELVAIIDAMAKKYIKIDKEKGELVFFAEDEIIDFEADEAFFVYESDSSLENGENCDADYKNLGLVFNSKIMKSTLDLVERIATTDTTVLIEGETGTGKGQIARLLHLRSSRKDSAFLDVNCAAIPEKLLESELFGYEPGSFTGARSEGKEGLFEAAKGGTVFLDEINSLPLALQVKFLRVIQEKEIMRIGSDKYIPIDVRIIVASNSDLLNLVNANLFREDLYYRLNVVPILVPALRKRKDDIPMLVMHFLDKCNLKYKSNIGISDKAIDALKKYKWPGNVRELENMIERLSIIVDSELIVEADVEGFFSNVNADELFQQSLNMSLKDKMEVFEKKIIENEISKQKNRNDLAEALGIDKSTLTRKLKKYGIKL